MNKPTLRKKYLNQRLSLSADEHKQLNQQLIETLFGSVELSEVRYLHIFLSIEKFKEVDTWQIIDRLKKEYPLIQLVIPKVFGDGLEHYLYEGKQQLITDKWGIPEPVSGERISPKQIDLVLAPLVVADHLGNRIGYGKGYYDKFLVQCRPEVKKIGLSLLPLSKESIEVEETDVKLDSCVTPADLKPFR